LEKSVEVFGGGFGGFSGDECPEEDAFFELPVSEFEVGDFGRVDHYLLHIFLNVSS